MTDAFNFNNWVVEYKLDDIKQCFIDHNMISLDTLKMDNSNYVKLIGDPRVLCLAHLSIHVTIYNALSALNELRKRQADQNKKEKNNEQQVDEKKENKPIIKHISIFWSEAEGKVLQNIESNIAYLNKKHLQLESTFQTNVQLKMVKNNQLMNQYQTKMKQQITEIRCKVDSIFCALEHEIEKNKCLLKDKMNKYKTDIEALEMNHIRQTKIAQDRIESCLSIIEKDINYFSNVNKQCKLILIKYPNKINNSNNWNIFDSSNTQRETQIVQKCNIAQEEYKKQSIILNDNINEICKYTSTKLQFPKHIYPSINQKLFNRICNDLHTIIQITDKNMEEKMNEEIKKSNNHHRSSTQPQLPQSETQIGMDNISKYNALHSVSPSSTTSASKYLGYADFQIDRNDRDWVISQTDWLHAKLAPKKFITINTKKQTIKKQYQNDDVKQAPRSIFGVLTSKRKAKTNVDKNIILQNKKLDDEPRVVSYVELELSNSSSKEKVSIPSKSKRKSLKLSINRKTKKKRKKTRSKSTTLENKNGDNGLWWR